MANKIKELDSLIYGEFDSQAEFAREIGWGKQKLNKIVNGEQTPSIIDVQTIAEGLGVPFMAIARFFLKVKVAK